MQQFQGRRFHGAAKGVEEPSLSVAVKHSFMAARSFVPAVAVLKPTTDSVRNYQLGSRIKD